MKVKVQELYASPIYKKVFEWGKLLSITGLSQVTVQAIGFISGILVIRLLPTDQYALYTLANTMLVTMTTIADGGISSGVMSQGGKVWQDQKKLGIVLATGLNLRKKFATGSVIFSAPILLFLLRHHGADWDTSILIVLSLFPAFYFVITGSLYEIIPKLQQNISKLQRIQIVASLWRLLLIGLTLFPFPYVHVAIIAGGLPQIWTNLYLSKIARNYVDHKQKPDSVIKKEILTMVKRILPDSLYYSLSGQMTVWLITLFGTTVAIAQVGALSKLTMAVIPFSILIGLLVAPRFARLPAYPKLLFNRFIQIQILLLLISIGLIGMSYMFSSYILLLFGDGYANLEKEVVIAMIGNCLGLIAGVSFNICISRGWVINPGISIITNVLSIVCGVTIFEVNSLQGVFILNIFINAIMAIMHATYGLLQTKKTV